MTGTAGTGWYGVNTGVDDARDDMHEVTGSEGDGTLGTDVCVYCTGASTLDDTTGTADTRS